MTIKTILLLSTLTLSGIVLYGMKNEEENKALVCFDAFSNFDELDEKSKGMIVEGLGDLLKIEDLSRNTKVSQEQQEIINAILSTDKGFLYYDDIPKDVRNQINGHIEWICNYPNSDEWLIERLQKVEFGFSPMGDYVSYKRSKDNDILKFIFDDRERSNDFFSFIRESAFPLPQRNFARFQLKLSQNYHYTRFSFSSDLSRCIIAFNYTPNPNDYYRTDSTIVVINRLLPVNHPNYMTTYVLKNSDVKYVCCSNDGVAFAYIMHKYRVGNFFYYKSPTKSFDFQLTSNERLDPDLTAQSILFNPLGTKVGWRTKQSIAIIDVTQESPQVVYHPL